MRADVFLFEQKYFDSRNKASEALSRGDVLIDGKAVKPSYDVVGSESVQIIDSALNCVSNGGYKLIKAINDFNVDLSGLKAVDVGASTGGFTECLLNAGAIKVYAVDVGENQLHKKLLEDKRVIVKDNTNARFLNVELLGEKVDVATIDVSFISLTYVLSSVSSVLNDNGFIIALIKPQFECENKNINKNGIVNKNYHYQIISKIYDYCIKIGLFPFRITNAPIVKGKNIEYLMLINKQPTSILCKTDIEKLILLKKYD